MRLVKRQEFGLEPFDLLEQIKSLRSDVDKLNDTRNSDKLKAVLEVAPIDLKLALKACSEKGASSWVTAVPSFDHGTVLHKGEFTDSVYIRYGWQLPNLPTTCACGISFSVQHALD